MQAPPPVDAVEFAAVMDRLGPFELHPLVAVAVSGGPDSMAAALLTSEWAKARGGAIRALIVDHGLRTESAAEAALVATWVASLGIAAVVLRIDDLKRGPALAERARMARHGALEAACAAHGIVHLVFGHHANDQAETVVMRMLRQSQAPGLAAMAALTEGHQVRKLRPCLGMLPERLRATLLMQDVPWVDDPSNSDHKALRPRLRAGRARALSATHNTRALVTASVLRGRQRATHEAAWQDELARKVTVSPLGYALLEAGSIAPQALANLLGAIGGGMRPPALSQVGSIAANLRPGTLAGVRIMPAGRLGSGWLLLREAAAMQGAIPALPQTLWDGRFRLIGVPAACHDRPDVTIAAWDNDAPRGHDLPNVVLRTLPVLRARGMLIATTWELFEGEPPHIVSAPFFPAATAPFFPLPTG